MNFCCHFIHFIVMISSNYFVIVFCRCSTSIKLLEMQLVEWSCNQDVQGEFGDFENIIHMFVYHMLAFSVYFSTKESYTVYAWFDYKCLDIFIFWLTGAYFGTFFADVLAFGVVFFGTRICPANWWVYFLSCFVCFIYDDAL